MSISKFNRIVSILVCMSATQWAGCDEPEEFEASAQDVEPGEGDEVAALVDDQIEEVDGDSSDPEDAESAVVALEPIGKTLQFDESDEFMAPIEAQGTWYIAYCDLSGSLKADVLLDLTVVQSGYGPLVDFHKAQVRVFNPWGRNKNNVNLTSSHFGKAVSHWTSFDNLKANTLTTVSSASGNYPYTTLPNWFLSALSSSKPRVYAQVIWDKADGPDPQRTCDIKLW